MTEILQGGKRDAVFTDVNGADAGFTITNFTEKKAFDTNTVTLSDTSKTLSTLVRELIRRGIINGTVV
jgi:hypothetical protein